MPKTTHKAISTEINDAFFRLESFMNGTIQEYQYFGFNDAFSILFNETKKIENYTYKNCQLIGQYWSYKGAIADFNKAIKLAPNYFGNYNNRGDAKYKLGDSSGAMADFNRSIELAPPDCIGCYDRRGELRFKLGDYIGAIADYTKMITLNPNNLYIYYKRGLSKLSLKDYMGAIADFNKIVELKPNNAEAYFMRGNSKAILHDKEGACMDLSKAGELGCAKAYDSIKMFCH